ncbi:N-acetyltransferase 9-like protein [Schistocerca gregaria]|uniref:N-acetyltransferase 9-like protein n=1 Tax=Schistocerca gregaria TaxID=7010 RepID=UPI00211E8C46|nr:N-acetyltransferase 9-like protein [Schistocerca gregaria]
MCNEKIHDLEQNELVGQRAVLTAFRPEHIKRYHRWMQNPTLKKDTGSEDLKTDTIEDIADYQRQIVNDENNKTFIILDTASREMVGDINLFISECDGTRAAEINVMIAEVSARRKGYAREAVKLAMEHLHKTHFIDRFVARISDMNFASTCLFRDRLGFLFESHSQIFSESTWYYDIKREDGALAPD